jgi:hypothetical protein
MHYQRNWVLAAYRAEHEQRRNPSAQILANFDQLLFDLYDAEITAQANGVVLTQFRRSILAYFASRSEATGPAVQVRHAYEFFNNTNPTP